MEKQFNPVANLVKDKFFIVSEQKKQIFHGHIAVRPGHSFWRYDLHEELTLDNIHKVDIKKDGGTVYIPSLSEPDKSHTHYTLQDPPPGVLFEQALNKRNALKHFQKQLQKIYKKYEPTPEEKEEIERLEQQQLEQ